MVSGVNQIYDNKFGQQLESIEHFNSVNLQSTVTSTSANIETDSQDQNQINSLRDELMKEVEFVHKSISKFNEDLKNKIFIDKVYIINTTWFNKWKDTIRYEVYESQIKKKELEAQTHGNSRNQNKITTQGMFFNNWNNSQSSNLQNLLLEARIQEENEYKQKLLFCQESKIKNQDENQNEVKYGADENIYSTEYLKSLLPLKEINNIEILLDFNEYIKDQNSKSDDVETNLQNFALKEGFNLSRDATIVSQEVMEFLQNKYGVDYSIPLLRNMKCELWVQSLRDRYIFNLEQVRLLIMTPNINQEEPNKLIKILTRNYEELIMSDNSNKLFRSSLPVSMQQNNIPNSPAIIQQAFKITPAPPPPPSALNNVLPICIPPSPPLTGSQSYNLQQKQIKFDFCLRQDLIFARKQEKIRDLKKRICQSMGKIDDFDENFRLWKYETSSSWNISFDSIVQNLTNELQKNDFNDENNIGNIIFPGINLDVISYKTMESLNSKLGGRICNEREILFLEVKNNQNQFYFKHSPNQQDYFKCKNQYCQKIGLNDKIFCSCQKQVYCSQKCLEKDQTHIDTCEEKKKQEYDLTLLKFIVEENPRNGLCGLNNIGNTCYMNSALQCLSHTQPLMKYFSKLMLFKNQLNNQNIMASKNNEITINFAKLMDQLWNKAKPDSESNHHSKYSSFEPRALKMSIGNNNKLFKGYQQHDSNELIQFLLDQIHEDLNRVKIKPLITMPSDEQIEQLTDFELFNLFNEAHLNRNQSIIQDLIYGQFKNTIQCLKCNNISKKIDQFLTLPVSIPQESFNLKFVFVPYQLNEKGFMNTLMDLQLTELTNLVLSENNDTKLSSLSLYVLKKKMCQIVQQFYQNTHYDTKRKNQVKFSLSSHSQVESNFVDIIPQDLVIASVMILNGSYKFLKIFSEHKDHTLIDIANHLDKFKDNVCIFVYQLDPQAVNLQEIRSLQSQETDHLIQFPKSIVPGFLLVPVEVSLFDKENYLIKKQKLNSQSKQQVITLPDLIQQPPRFVVINNSWTSEMLHKQIISLFCQVVPDNNKKNNFHNINNYDSYKKNNNGYEEQKLCGRQKLKKFHKQSEYDYSNNLSDEYSMQDNYKYSNQKNQQNGLKNYSSSQKKHDFSLYQPRPYYHYHELFEYLLAYKHQNNKYPDMKELDYLEGDFVQPISLNIFSKQKTFHTPINDKVTCENLQKNLVDQKKSLGCNDYIFTDLNSISQVKIDIFKFQILFNLNEMPHNVTQNDLVQNLQNVQIYDKQFVFDRQSRLTKSFSQNQNNQINSSSYGQEIDMMEGSCTGQKTISLSTCLQKMKSPQILQGANAYLCNKCKTPQKATFVHQIYRMGPIAIMCLQRFKDGKKNNDLINFPLQNLNMKEFVESCNSSIQGADSCLYDLYGVIYHSGSLVGGHYTAKCFNQEYQKWFNFNDSQVTLLQYQQFEELKKEIVTPNAYILFYMKQNINVQTKEQFDQIKIQATGSADHLIKRNDLSLENEKIDKDQYQFIGEEQQQFEGNTEDVVYEVEQDQMNLQTKLEQNILEMSNDIDLDDIQQIKIIEFNSIIEEQNKQKNISTINNEIPPLCYNQTQQQNHEYGNLQIQNQALVYYEQNKDSSQCDEQFSYIDYQTQEQENEEYIEKDFLSESQKYENNIKDSDDEDFQNESNNSIDYQVRED